MELFLSTYQHKVDRKGRVSVPATFRSLLARQRDPNLVVLFRSFQLTALEGTGSDRMEEISERLESPELSAAEYENLTQVFADAHQLAIDNEGRIVLPEILKDHAQISDEVSFVGLGKMFQIWQPSLYEAHSAMVRERAVRAGTTWPTAGGRRPT